MPGWDPLYFVGVQFDRQQTCMFGTITNLILAVTTSSPNIPTDQKETMMVTGLNLCHPKSLESLDLPWLVNLGYLSRFIFYIKPELTLLSLTTCIHWAMASQKKGMVLPSWYIYYVLLKPGDPSRFKNVILAFNSKSTEHCLSPTKHLSFNTQREGVRCAAADLYDSTDAFNKSGYVAKPDLAAVDA